MHLIDLSAVAITRETIKILADHFAVHKLVLGKTPGGCEENLELEKLSIPFDSSSIRYSGPNGLNQMLEDATTFTFRSISFSSNANVFETPFVNKFLKACANRCKNSTRRVGMHLIDLSAVVITRETIKILADHFAVHKFVLVRTLESHLSDDDIFNLYIACHENSIFHCLGIPFDSSSIRYSGLNGLNQMLEDATTFTFRSISFSSNANVFETPFVNKFLKACANRCKNSMRRVGMHLIDLSAVAITRETIKILADHFAVHKLVLGIPFDSSSIRYSGPNGLNQMLEDATTFTFRSIILSSCKQILSIKINYGENLVSTLYSLIPTRVKSIEIVNSLGLHIDQALVLSSCKQILSIKINYGENLVRTLYSFIPTRVKSIEIVNSLGKKKTKAMDMFCIRDLLHSRDQLYIKLSNCKIAIPNNLANYFAANHVQITRTSNTCEIRKTPKET
ncbi:hypothetical protein TSAR_014634 [Trichomalopsis sarcophagae]|uniref:Uncharacterized protein n=1 Tax=Trichomalopsis sarcophagae TaxID=543379 RepID=A0A232EDA4_9HYME|nr:hypothetical protein TSAR_014634 [Trichomalopsis sarcophagae]